MPPQLRILDLLFRLEERFFLGIKGQQSGIGVKGTEAYFEFTVNTHDCVVQVGGFRGNWLEGYTELWETGCYRSTMPIAALSRTGSSIGGLSGS